MSEQKREPVVLTDVEAKSLQIAAGVFADKLWFPDEVKREAADAIFKLLERSKPKPTIPELIEAFHREPGFEARQTLYRALLNCIGHAYTHRGQTYYAAGQASKGGHFCVTIE
jgi:hypothetical protein